MTCFWKCHNIRRRTSTLRTLKFVPLTLTYYLIISVIPSSTQVIFESGTPGNFIESFIAVLEFLNKVFITITEQRDIGQYRL